jgi:hypothetical protein
VRWLEPTVQASTEPGAVHDLADASAAGLLAWFSLIHVPDDEVPAVFAHFRRVLRPGGPLLLGCYVATSLG